MKEPNYWLWYHSLKPYSEMRRVIRNIVGCGIPLYEAIQMAYNVAIPKSAKQDSWPPEWLGW